MKATPLKSFTWIEKATGRTLDVKAKSEKESGEVLSFLIENLDDWEMKV